jgi:hypothetical protein
MPEEVVKRPCSAYILYCKEKRGGLTENDPKLKGKDVLVELGKGWKALSEKSKKKYLDAAEAAQVEFKKKYPDGLPRKAAKSKKHEHHHHHHHKKDKKSKKDKKEKKSKKDKKSKKSKK